MNSKIYKAYVEMKKAQEKKENEKKQPAKEKSKEM